MSSRLDPAKVPQSAVPFIPLAERWEIGDDPERDGAVKDASREEKEELVRALKAFDRDFWDWLGDPPAEFTPEYRAMSILVEAAEYAEVVLRKHG